MKVVINSCYGGFSLSEEAIKAYFVRKGKTLYRYHSAGPGFGGPFVRFSGKKEGFFFYHFTEDMGDSFTETNDWQKHGYFYDHDIDRNDSDFVAVVEELGDRANGDCAELRVIEIPDGVEYEIDEDDGLESVHEKHRSWA